MTAVVWWFMSFTGVALPKVISCFVEGGGGQNGIVTFQRDGEIPHRKDPAWRWGWGKGDAERLGRGEG